ncbi:hypothetical protein [Haloplanus sp. C73]|uniref:hypothetical protein n=1 Tax=Haloplanus sp. C73 TaxID=3421641 RepID=UPI003EB7551B
MRRVLAAILVVGLLAPAAAAQSEDTAEPRIEWSSPWERSQYEGVPDGDPDWTATDGTLDLEATVHDDSAIESVTIRRVYEAEVDGHQERDQRTIRLGSTERIDETVHLGTHGRTRLTITATDVAGNTRVARVTVEVDDTTAPTADLSATLLDDGAVRVQGTVTDDTQVDSVRLHSVRGTKIVSPQQGSIDITQNTVDIDARVQAPPKGVDGVVTVDLVDREGNTRTITVPVEDATTPTSPATEVPTDTPTPQPTATTTATPVATPSPEPTATATPVNLSGLPVQTSTPSTGSNVGIGGVLKILGLVALGLVGAVIIASQMTGGRR